MVNQHAEKQLQEKVWLALETNVPFYVASRMKEFDGQALKHMVRNFCFFKKAMVFPYTIYLFYGKKNHSDYFKSWIVEM